MGFVISDGALKSIGEQSSGFISPYFPRGTQLTPRLAMSYGEIYRTQPAVRTVVDFLARNVASLACQSFRRLDDNDRERLAPDKIKNPMAYMLEKKANPRSTAFRLWSGTVRDKAIYDVAFWMKTKVGSQTTYVRRIPVRRVTPVGGSWLDADTYRIQGNNGFMDVPAENMVIFNGYEPDDDRVGTSPLETLRLILAEEVEAAQYRAQLWARGARAAMVITRPHDAPDWEDGERNRFLRDWRAQYAGDGPNAGGTPLLEDGMTVAAVGVTPKEAQYVESRKLTREEVSALYHIPAPFIGILDHATFSNIAEQHIQLYVDVMGPWCDEMSQEVNAQVVPDFYPDGLTYCEFNIQEKLAGDFERQATVIQSATGAPWLLRSEARARFNLPFIEGTDVLVTPLNVSGGQQASPNDSAPPAPGAPVDAPVTDPGADPAAPPADNTTGGKARRAAGKAAATEAHKSGLAAVYAKTFVRQQKAVLARYGELSKSRKATGPDAHELFDRARWDRDLSLDLTVPALSLVAEVGQAAAGTLPDASFDDALTPNYVAAQCAGTAAAVNQTTQDQITAALTAPDVEVALAGVFALALASRAAALGAGHAANLAGWATVEAGHQYGGPALKTWNTGPNPRPSHAAMSGQTVPLDGIFSNGARWPADAVSLGIDDVAGCNCSLTITPEGATL